MAISGLAFAIHSLDFSKPEKTRFQYGSSVLPLSSAAPMAGTCDEPPPAMILSTTHFRFVRDLDFALLLTLAALSRPDLLRLPSTERPPASIISAYSFGVDPVMRAAMRSNEAKFGGEIDVAAKFQHT